MERKKKKSGTGFLWIFKQSKGSRGLMLLLVLSSVINAGVDLAMTFILKEFTDYAMGMSRQTLTAITVVAMVILLLGSVFLIVSSMLKKLMYARMEGKLRHSIVQKVLGSSMLDVQKIHSGELLTRMTKDAETVSQCLPTLVDKVFYGVLSAVVSLCAMFILSWKLSLALLIVIPLMLAIMSAYNPKLQQATAADKVNEDINRNQMQDALSNVPLLKTYNAQPMVLRKLSETYRQKYQSTKALGIANGVFSCLNQTIGAVMYLVTMGFGAYLAVQGEFSVGSMIAIINLLNRIVWPIASIAGSMAEVNQAIVSARRIEEVFQLPDVVEPSLQQPLVVSKLIAENVSFEYLPDVPVLSDLSAQFFPNRVTGIIGQSGSGKSTLLRLLLGLYQPGEGSIRLIGANDDGREQAIEGTQMNAFMAYVPSDNFIYTATVRENITMGADADEDRIWRSAEIANIADFIRGLPEGLDEKIGSGGLAVSSGQAQRIAIARAICRNAQVVILDEPTSNLDQASISILRNVLKRIAEDRIVILVTHEMETAGICDKVYKLEKHFLSEVDPISLSATIETLAEKGSSDHQPRKEQTVE